jgi:hypothetical protein
MIGLILATPRCDEKYEVSARIEWSCGHCCVFNAYWVWKKSEGFGRLPELRQKRQRKKECARPLRKEIGGFDEENMGNGSTRLARE